MHFSAESSPLTSACDSGPSSPETEVTEPLDDAPSRVVPEQYVLITGGLGYIGSHTSLELLKAGYNVVIVDDYSNSFADVFDRIRTVARTHFAGCGGKCPSAQSHQLDYKDTAAMRALLDSYRPTSAAGDQRPSSIIGVIHFAAFKAVEESIRQPLKYYHNNINGLVDLLSLLDEYNIKNFIFSSSAAVYGTASNSQDFFREEQCVHQEETFQNTDGTEKHAEQGCAGITSPYGRTKFFGEAILSDLASSDPSWNILALRYFNPVGCDASGFLGEDPKVVPSNLLPVVVKVLTGEWNELSVYGTDWNTSDGTAVRDFIHVTDLARGHTAALSAASGGRVQRGFRTYNIGTGAGHSVMEVVAAMELVSGRSVSMKMVGRRAGDVQSSVAVADRARLELGWSAGKSLTDACQDVWGYLRLRGMYFSGDRRAITETLSHRQAATT